MNNTSGLLHTKKPLNTGKLISAYYLEIEYLLERVEGATTHYQTLGVERSASSDHIIKAYQKSVGVLHPPYHKVRAAVPDEMLVRVDNAFKKISQAFSVLTDTKERAAYQRSLDARLYITKPLNTPGQTQKSPDARQPKARKAADKAHVKAEGTEIKVITGAHALFTKASSGEATSERRPCERVNRKVPALILGYEC